MMEEHTIYIMITLKKYVIKVNIIFCIGHSVNEYKQLITEHIHLRLNLILLNFTVSPQLSCEPLTNVIIVT